MSVNGIEDVWCLQPETTFAGALLDHIYAYRDRWTMLNFARFNNLSVLIERARTRTSFGRLAECDWRWWTCQSLCLTAVEYSFRLADCDEFSDSHHFWSQLLAEKNGHDGNGSDVLISSKPNRRMKSKGSPHVTLVMMMTKIVHNADGSR